MIAIDLLPPEEAVAAAASRRSRRLGAMVGGTVAIGLLLGHVAVEGAAAVTNRRLARIGAELTALDRPVTALRRLRQRRAALGRRLGMIAALEAPAAEPVSLLETLADAAPSGLWLTELTLVDGRLRLAGLAEDEQTIADFLAHLRRIGSLGGVDLEEAASDEHAHPRRFVVAGRIGDRR